MKIHKNDTVLVVTGKDRGKKGKVRQAIPRDNRIIVEGVHIVKRHSRTRGQARQGGIIEMEAPINVSNVMLLCAKCNKPARIGTRVLPTGQKARYCRVCSELID